MCETIRLWSYRVLRPPTAAASGSPGTQAAAPGKITLMELISKHGSIPQAGKEMACRTGVPGCWWTRSIASFTSRWSRKQMGGSGGGGARLTKLGRYVVGRYRAIEGAAASPKHGGRQRRPECRPNQVGPRTAEYIGIRKCGPAYDSSSGGGRTRNAVSAKFDLMRQPTLI